MKRRQAKENARTIVLRLATTALVPLLLMGCGIGSERKDPLEIEAQKLEAEKAELTRELQQCQAENIQLAEQVKALSAIPEGKRLDPYKLTGVRIGKYSNFYDKTGDGIHEKLIVYIKATDTNGDIVKAAGAVNVQLWNLNNPSDEALLGQWQVDPNELHKLWFSTIVSASYRLTFDTPAALDTLAEPLTVKVAFTDYLTGETFHVQKAIDPRL